MTKKIMGGIFIIFLAGGVWLAYRYMQKETERSVLSVLPEDAVYILKTDALTDTWEEVSGTNIWKHLIQTKGFEYLQPIDTLLNNALLDNKAVSYIFKNRPTAMAAYMTAPDDYDFMYAFDLQKTEFIKKVLDRLLQLGKSYKVVKVKYKQTQIYKMIPRKEEDKSFFVSALDNVLLVSFSYPLIKKVIEQKELTHWEKQPAFKQIQDELSGGLVQFYFNYKQLPAFTRVFSEEAVPNTRAFARQMLLSGFDVDQDDERITMDGYTLTDSIPSYMNALLDVKPGKLSAYEIASSQTAMMTSISFKNFNLFYQSLLSQTTDKQQKNTYRQNVKKLEKFFKIDLQKDLFDWIGQEIAIVKMYSGNKQRPADVVMLLQAQDVSDARKGLQHIAEQIRKRSPFKFKSYPYKNFPVMYLHQKRFFKTILGDMFAKIDKPYYTIIEDFVVFSNSEPVLKAFIDDYIKGKTLSHDKDFMDFKSEFNNKSNLFVYMQMPKLYKIIRNSLTPESRKSLDEKKDFLLSFSRIGLQLISKDDQFKSLLVIDHDQEALKKEQAETLAKQVDRSIHHTFFEDLQFKIAFPDSLQVADGKYKQYYDDGKTLKAEGKVEDGLPVGIWRTYYASGNLQSVAHYDEGEINGDVFYFFDKHPEQLMAEMHYEDDLLEDEYLEYWEAGAQKAQLHYKDGKLHGEAKYFYPTGKIKIKGKYRKGEKKGKWHFYDAKGKETHTKRYSGFLF